MKDRVDFADMYSKMTDEDFSRVLSDENHSPVNWDISAEQKVVVRWQ